MNDEQMGMVEKYLTRSLNQKDRQKFEQQLIGDFELQEEFRSYRILFYLDNKLPKEDRLKFENDLISDVNLKEDVRLQKLASDVIEDHQHHESTMNSWESYKELIKDYPENTNSVNSTDIIRNNKYQVGKSTNAFSRFSKIAAVLAIFFIASILAAGYNMVSISNQELAQSGVEDTQLLGASRSAVDSENTVPAVNALETLSTKLNIAMTLLNNYEYEEVIPLLKAAKEQAEEEGSDKLLEIQWALATAYVGINETDKAMNEYEEISSFDERKKQIIQKAKKNLYILKIKEKLGLEN